MKCLYPFVISVDVCRINDIKLGEIVAACLKGLLVPYVTILFVSINEFEK